MRAILVLFIVLAVAFVCVEMSAAAPGGEVKASPLFKRSLDESIASLEGKAPEAGLVKNQAEAMPTGKPGCPEPDAPLTSYGQPTCSETCEPTQCGGECYTQANTCFPTACGTCYQTCASTCSGPTCSSTCASTCAGSGPTYQGGVCCNANFYGTVSWINTYWYPPYGPSNYWDNYLSPYYSLRCYDYDYVMNPDAGAVDFRYGPGFTQGIFIDRFYYNGSYSGAIAAPNVSSYRIWAHSRSYYYPQYTTVNSHTDEQDFSGQPSSSQQVNLLIEIYRP